MIDNILWFFISLCPIISALIITRNLKPFRSSITSIIFCITLFIGFLFAGLFIGGIIGKINLYYVGITELIFLICILLIWPRINAQPIKPYNILTQLKSGDTIALLAATTAFLGIIRACNNINFPQYCDTPRYHLPIAQWFNDYGLLKIPDAGFSGAYPANVSLIYSWISTLTDNYIALALWNVFMAALLGLFGYGICRVLGLSKSVSSWGTAIVLSNFLLIRQVEWLYVDLTLAVFVIIGLYFVLEYATKPCKRVIICSAIGTGLALGTKPSGLIFAPLILITILWVLFSQNNGKPLKQAAKPLGLWLFTVIIFGGYWYIRNLYLMHGFFYAQPDWARPENTLLIENISGYFYEFGFLRFIKGVAGQTSWVTATTILPFILLVIDAIRKRKSNPVSAVQILFLLMCFGLLTIIVLHPYTARHSTQKPLIPAGQLRYAIANLTMFDICWVILLANWKRLLPILCLGISLPASKTAFTIALAAIGLIKREK